MNPTKMSKAVEEIAEDIEMTVPENGGDREVIPAGVYPAICTRIYTDDVPDWKQAYQTNPDPENKQWAWVFTLSGGDYDGMTFASYTTRTLHPKSNAHKYALAIMGVKELAPGQSFSSKALIGLPCRLALSDTNAKGEPKNYIDKVLPRRNPNGRLVDKPSLVQPDVPALHIPFDEEDD